MKLRLPNKLIAAIMAAASPVLFQTLSTATLGAAAVAMMGVSATATSVTISNRAEQVPYSEAITLGEGEYLTLNCQAAIHTSANDWGRTLSTDENKVNIVSGKVGTTGVTTINLNEGAWYFSGTRDNATSITGTTTIKGSNAKSLTIAELTGDGSLISEKENGDTAAKRILQLTGDNSFSGTLTLRNSNAGAGWGDNYLVLSNSDAVKNAAVVMENNRYNNILSLNVETASVRKLSGKGILNLTKDSGINGSGTTSAATLTVTGSTVSNDAFTGTINSGVTLKIDEGAAQALGDIALGDASSALVIGKGATINIIGNTSQGTETARTNDNGFGTVYYDTLTLATGDGSVSVGENVTWLLNGRTPTEFGSLSGDHKTISSVGGLSSVYYYNTLTSDDAWDNTRGYTSKVVINTQTQDYAVKFIDSNVLPHAALTITSGKAVMQLSENTAVNYDGVLTGNGSFIKDGAGVLTLSGDNANFGGDVTVNAGTLVVGNNQALGANNTTSTRAITINTGAVLDVNGSEGTNTNYKVTLNGGKLTNTGGQLGTNKRQLALNLDVTANSTVEVLNSKNFGMIGASYAATKITLNGNILEKTGAGTYYLTHTTVTGTGALKVTNGTLEFRNDGGAGSLESNIIMNGGNVTGTVHLGKPVSITATNGNGSVSAAIDTHGHNLTVGGTANKTFSGVISGSGSVIKADNNTVTLTGTNTYTGGTEINAGTLILNNQDNTSAALGSGAVMVSNGAKLQFSGSTNTTIGSITLNGAELYNESGFESCTRTLNTLTVNGESNLTQRTWNTLWYIGALNKGTAEEPRSLTWLMNTNHSTNSVLSLTDAGTFDGTLHAKRTQERTDPYSNGSYQAYVEISHADALQNAVLKATGERTSYMTIALNADTVNLAGLQGDDKSILMAGGANKEVGSSSDKKGTIVPASSGTSALVINSKEDANDTFAGQVLSGISITKKGAGTQTFSGTLTDFNGDITVNAGTLNMTGTLNSADTDLTVNGGTLNLGGDAHTIGSLVINDGGTVVSSHNSSSTGFTQGSVDINAGGTLELTNSDALGWSNTNTAAINMTGTADKHATMAVSGKQTFCTTLNMNGYADVIDGVGDSDNKGLEIFRSGDDTPLGTINATGVGNKISTGLFLRNQATITTAAGAELTISGNIGTTGSGSYTSSGSFIKEGAGALILSSENNTYAGATIINDGALIAANSTAVASSSELKFADLTAAESAHRLLAFATDASYDSETGMLTGTLIDGTIAGLSGYRGTVVANTLTINVAEGGDYQFKNRYSGDTTNDAAVLQVNKLVKQGAGTQVIGGEYTTGSGLVIANGVDVQGGTLHLMTRGIVTANFDVRAGATLKTTDDGANKPSKDEAVKYDGTITLHGNADSMGKLTYTDGSTYANGGIIVDGYGKVDIQWAKQQHVQSLSGTNATLILDRRRGETADQQGDAGCGGYLHVYEASAAGFSGTIKLINRTTGNEDGGLVLHNNIGSAFANTVMDFTGEEGSNTNALLAFLPGDATYSSDKKLTNTDFAAGTVAGLVGTKGAVYANNLTINTANGAKYTYGGAAHLSALTKKGDGEQKLDLATGSTLGDVKAYGGTVNIVLNGTASANSLWAYTDSTITYDSSAAAENHSGSIDAFHMEGGTIEVKDGNLTASNMWSANNSSALVIDDGAKATVTGKVQFGTKDSSIEIQGAGQFTGAGMVVTKRDGTTADAATIVHNTGTTAAYFYRTSGDYTISHAQVKITANDSATMRNLLIDSALINNSGRDINVTNEANTLTSVHAQAGAVVVNNADRSAETLKSIKATGGNVTMKGLLQAAGVTLNELVIGDGKTVSATNTATDLLALNDEPTPYSDATVFANIEVTGTQEKHGTINVGMGGTTAGINLAVDTEANHVDYSAIPGNVLDINGGSLTLNTLPDSSSNRILLSDSMMGQLANNMMIEVMSGIGALTVNDYILSAEAISGMNAGDIVTVGAASTVFGNDFGNQNAQVLFRADGGTGTLLVTPEPTTTALSLLALAGLAARRRRK